MKTIYLISILFLFTLSACQRANNKNSEGLAALGVYGKIDTTQKKYVDAINNSLKTEQFFDTKEFRNYLNSYNANSTKLAASADPIDAFVGGLPTHYRRHFSMIHKSFSIQSATPLAPRVILYGPDAQVMMTFNAGKDENGKTMAGGDSIEVIEFDDSKKIWKFSEISFDENKKLHLEENPKKCVMCHTGTPKAIESRHAQFYMDDLKPIFPQYPFWPGFYGSVNDIVGFKGPGSKDTIMHNLKDTVDQIKDLTFDTTEELFRLRELLDKNPDYLKVVENELTVHQTYFQKLMDGIKTRDRYKHLLTVKDLYLDKGEKVPEALLTAPYRRSFAKTYGHYLLRPNFYLSSLMSFYHAQYIAERIETFPEYEKFKHSLLARKYNCGPITSGGLSLSDLDSTFDLVYPNIVDPTIRNKQYLLSYQFNIPRASLGGPAALPLHTWNLEGNEEIASYHYGNVFSDLNELVLWQLVHRAHPDVAISSGRSAAEGRHFELSNNFMKKMLEDHAQGYVARMSTANYKFANSAQSYYGQAKKLNAQPTASICASHLIPAAKKELAALASEKEKPHDRYTVDPRFVQEIPTEKNKYAVHLVRQSCEGCHTDYSVAPDKQIKPGFNVDWYSDTFHLDVHQHESREHDVSTASVSHADLFKNVMATSTLPVPFGNKMPFARRPFDGIGLECENLLLETAKTSSAPRKGKPFICDTKNPAEKDSLACKCHNIFRTREKIYRDYFPTDAK